MVYLTMELPEGIPDISPGYPGTPRLASFERTTDLVFDAAARARVDPIKGVSERLGSMAIHGDPEGSMAVSSGKYPLVN